MGKSLAKKGGRKLQIEKADVKGNGSRPVKPAPGRPSSGGNNDALIEEAFKGKTETVMALLKDNNKDYQDKNGRTVLIAAAEGGHEQLVSKLIKFGVDLRKENDQGVNAFILAAEKGHLE